MKGYEASLSLPFDFQLSAFNLDLSTPSSAGSFHPGGPFDNRSIPSCYHTKAANSSLL